MTKPRYPREAWVFYDKDGDPVQIVDTTDGDFLMIAGKCYCKTCECEPVSKARVILNDAGVEGSAHAVLAARTDEGPA